jgi:hypothetical protein
MVGKGTAMSAEIIPNYELYRAQKLKDGQEFQDFIMERAARIGTILNPYCSREGQKLGENMLGMEIKCDGKYRETGNLCIEVGEKARPRPGDFAKAGIMRSDNSWLYGIGDQMQFWIFAISTLRHFFERRKEMGLREYAIKTSIGFLLPLSKADKFCARRIDFDFDGGIKAIWNGLENCSVDLSDKCAIPEQQFHLKLL